MNKIISSTFKILCALSVSVHLNFAFAQECESNFETKGMVLTGQTYSTIAGLQGVSDVDAFQAVQKAMAQEGWNITSTEPEKGIISALNSQAVRPSPLTIMIVKAPLGSRIAMQYSNPAGAFSPEAAIRAQFCKLVAAAQVAPPAAAVQVVRPIFTGNPNLANISDAQLAKLDAALNKPIQDAKVSAMVAEARPIIRDVIGRLACLKSFDSTTFPRFLVPGGDKYTHGPANSATYHNKSLCLAVDKLRDWNALALNAFSFEVIYLAEDSGESVTRKYKLIKQPDGEWLFANV